MALHLDFAGEEGNEVNNPQSQPQQQDNEQLIKLTKYPLKDKSWLQNNSDRLENEIRKMVRPVVEHAIQRYSFLSISRPSSTESRKYKLRFEGTFPCQLFTENKLLAANGLAPVIRLLDAVSEQLVTDGPLSSKRVEIVALHGHFKAELLDDWTKSDFCENILTERDNKRPLLVGHCVTTLRNGIGLIDDVRFTDSSCWVRSKKFRLGAKLVDEQQDQVKEAVSTPIQVKDRRGETNQKHRIPSPDDEVWRLRWIARNGTTHKRLKEHQIHKVKDFVAQYYNDQSLLRNILKFKMKKWSEIIEQAVSCFPENACTNFDALAEFNVPNDQQEMQVPESSPVAVVGEHNHLLDQYMSLDNFLFNGVLAESSCSNNGHISHEDCCVPSLSSATMLNAQRSNWPLDQSTGEEGLGVFSLTPDSDPV